MNEKKLEKLSKQWRAAKAKLQKFQSEEIDLRLQIDLLLVQDKVCGATVTMENETIKFERQENYSIPKASISSIKEVLSDEIFDDVFTTSYKLKTAVYNKLGKENKGIIKEHLTIKPSPLRCTVKEL